MLTNSIGLDSRLQPAQQRLAGELGDIDRLVSLGFGLGADHEAFGQLLADADHLPIPLRPIEVLAGAVGLGGDIQVKDAQDLLFMHDGVLTQMQVHNNPSLRR